MRELAELQKHFQQYVLVQQAGIQTEIISTEKVPASARLDIYRHAYYLRLLEVFQLDYPGLHKLLGDEEFRLLGRRYIDANPSVFRSVRWFGQKLSNFMQTTSPYAERPILIEMARFEWLLTEAFDATDSEALSVDEMAAIPFDKWPEMRFEMQVSVKRVAFQWNIIQLWKETQTEASRELTCHEAPIDYLIWRKALAVQFCSLSPDEAYLIDAMLVGENFSAICEGLCEWLEPEAVAMHAASLLKRFIIDGVIHTVNF